MYTDLLEPLGKLEVVLEAALDELVDRHDLVNAFLAKRRLEMLEVLEEIVLGLGIELDLLDGDGSREEQVHELAVRGSRAEILDFQVVQLQRGVHPVDEVVAGDIVRGDGGYKHVNSCHGEVWGGVSDERDVHCF